MPDKVRDPREIIQFFTKLSLDEGCIVIAPHEEPFRPVERSFIEGIRRVPSSISAPPGVNPYSMVLGYPGSWMFVWIPDR